MKERPHGSTLAQVVAGIAAASPGHPAILFGSETIDYAALKAMAWRRAAALRALGIGAGDRIGILVGNEPEWVALALAASAIGVTLAPLNTWYKPAELAWTIRHCDLKLVVAQRRFLRTDYGTVFADLLAKGEVSSLAHLVMIGEPVAPALDFASFLAGGAAVDDAQIDVLAQAVDPETPAYVLYTSGSTAEPKGVLLTHRGVVENGFDLGQRRAIGPADRTWMGTPLFYALGATNALPATFTAGATLVLQGAFDAGEALRVIERTGATVYYGTGNMSRAIIDHPEFAPARIATLKKGNAGLGSEYKRLTLVEMGITGAVPAYGLTETYGNAAVGAWDDPLEVKLDTDGTALPGQEILVVDATSGDPLPPGETGLLLIRGHVTPGYLDNPEETAKALRPDGFFDTGDLGSVDADGRLRFHSRLKDVIKSGGINVSPSEVEQLIAAHPDVRDAHVVGAPDLVRGEVIVAFVDPLRPIGEAALKAWVREQAASFKTPHHVFFRSETQLPRLATGKIAKARLKEEARELLAP
jgi:fatty-acyl-CoA synthase